MTDTDGARRPPTTDKERRPPDATDERPSTDYSVAVSPRQLAGGFAILAAILVLLVRSRRRRRAKSDPG